MSGAGQSALALEGAAPAAVATRPAFTREHQFLVNALGFIAVQVIEDDRWPVVMRCIEEVLPLAPREGRMAEQICDAARQLLEAWPSRNKAGRGADWAFAMLAVQTVMADVYFWRGALALEAVRNAHGTGHGTGPDAPQSTTV